jgi:hypothetical protein
MNPEVLFEALAEVAGEHARNSGSDLLVVPLLSDELESRQGLLREVAEFLGGRLLDTTSGAYDGQIQAYDDAALRGAVEAGLTFTHRGGGETSLDLQYSDGLLDAVLRSRGRQVTVPSPAESQLMAISRALFDHQLIDDELAILLYDEKLFDEDSQRAVLSMLTGLGRQADIRLGSARTLVPLLRSTGLSTVLHCQRNRGIRYSLDGDILIRRHADRHMADTVRKLVVPREPPLVLFLGAGFSASSGMPVGNSIRDRTIRRICEIDGDELSSEQLAEALFRFAREADKPLLTGAETELGERAFAEVVTLEQVARIERDFFEEAVPRTIETLRSHHDAVLDQANPRLGAAVYALHRILAAHRRVVIVTVNFDELAEFGQRDHLDIAVDDEDFARAVPILDVMKTGGSHPDCKVPLLKLHGTISRPETCVVTDEQTRSGITTAKAEALRALVSDLSEVNRIPWVYVGASMRDIDLNRTFGENDFNELTSERWVTPWVEPSIQRFVDQTQRWWKASGDTLYNRTVTETADTFVRALADKYDAEYE